MNNVRLLFPLAALSLLTGCPAGTPAAQVQAQPRRAVVQLGQVLIHGGAPGHAVLVVDVVENPTTHEKFMLLAQSYMPAQDIHVLRPDWNASPWFRVDAEASMVGTPEWSFAPDELAQF